MIMLVDNIDSFVENEILDEDDFKGVYVRLLIVIVLFDFYNRDNECLVWDGVCVNGCGLDVYL